MTSRICTITNKPFTISNQEEAFGKEHGIPLPTISPIERLRQVCAFLSSVFLYNSKCALTQKDIITFIPPHKELTVYDIDTWMSDAWDPLSFGQEYDFSRPFFTQMQELLKKAPLPSLECIRSSMENSDYTNGVLNIKNCYLSFGVLHSEDVLFSRTVIDSKDIIDSIYVTKSELCCGCVMVNNCYNLKYSQDCSNCSDSAFLFDCQNCKNCYGCTNLVNKEYYWNNKQLTRAEFEEQRAKMDLGSRKIMTAEKRKFELLKQQAVVKYMQGKNNENSSGNYLDNTKDCKNCLFVSKAENVEWSIQMVHGTRNAFMTDGFGQNGEHIYFSSACGENAYNIKFCVDCYSNIRDLEYCIFVGFGSMDCFGCVGLNKKQYCIFNKQYPQERYEEILVQVIQQAIKEKLWGNFFPAHLSPIEEKDCVINFYVPLADEVPIEKVVEQYTANPTAQNSVINCIACQKDFRLVQHELDFYEKYGLPLPPLCSNCRHKRRLQQRNPRQLYSRKCMKCEQAVASTFSPSNTTTIYCQQCYEKDGL